MNKTVVEYTNDFLKIDKVFSINKGVYHKILKFKPEYIEDFKLLLLEIIIVSKLLNEVAIGINYNSPYCFTFKRWVLLLKDYYNYGKLLKKLGLDKEGSNKNYGFSSYHNGSKGLSATFKEKEIAFNINNKNGVDYDYNKSITINSTKNSKSYNLYISDEYQNSLECLAYKNASDQVAHLFLDMILCPYNSKKIKRTENYDNRIIDGNAKGMRSTIKLNGPAKTDLVDLNTGKGISVKNGSDSLLASTSPVEWLTILDYIFNVKKIKAEQKDIDHLYEIFDYKHLLGKPLYGLVREIRNNTKHKSYPIIVHYDEYHKYLTSELNKFCIKYPKFRKALYIELAKGESKFSSTCGAVPEYILNFYVDNPLKTELTPIDEYIETHIDNMSIKVSYKTTTPKAKAFTSVRVYILN